MPPSDSDLAGAIADRVLADRDQAQWARGFDDGLDVALEIIRTHRDMELGRYDVVFDTVTRAISERRLA